MNADESSNGSPGHTTPAIAPRPRINPDTQVPKRRGRTGWVITILVCVAIITGVVWIVRKRSAEPAKKPGGPAARGEALPVPVVLGTVMKKDVPVYLDGLGTVQAYQTVTIRPRVDGQIEKVAFVEGQDVRAGDVLAQIDAAPFKAQLDQVLAKKGQDEALLANAQVDLKRYADLLAHEGVTQQSFDTQKSLVTQLDAAVKADEAAISSVRVQLAYTTIASPIDGRTGIRQIDKGNIVHANDATGLVVITQLKPISVVFTLPEQMLDSIHSHATGEPFKVLAVGRDDASPIAEGKMEVVDNQIDTTTGTIRLKATFTNSDLKLWPGQFVNARLLLTVRTNSAVVPASVIQRGPEGAFAFVVSNDQTVDLRPVKIGQSDQSEVVIESGLHPGEKVVVDGQYKLQRGSRIKPADSPDAKGPGQGGGGRGRNPGGTNSSGRPKR